MCDVDQGVSFIVTRNGVPVGELVPLHGKQFVATEAAAALFRTAPSVDSEGFREDLDAAVDQDSTPRV